MINYLWRLYNLGKYKYFARKLINFSLLQRSCANVEGVPIALPDRIDGIKEELILYGKHEPLATVEYKRLLKPKDVIFDIGSNIGYYLLIADKALESACCIRGFEPDPELVKLAQENANKLNSDIRVEHFAISDRVGKVNFFVSDVANWGSVVENKELKQRNKIEVQATTIDNYVQMHGIWPTVLRMDIEGGEILALRGARQTLQRVRLVFIELHCMFLSDGQLDEILDILDYSNFTQFIWFDRYYDWPWSRPEAAKRSYSIGNVIDFRKAVQSHTYKVMTVFASRE